MNTRNQPASIVLAMLALFLSGSCASLLESSKYRFSDGPYTLRPLGGQKVYVSQSGDTIVAMHMAHRQADTTSGLLFLPQSDVLLPKASQAFYVASWDVDLLTIPFKYRPAVPGFPNQLNTSYNAAFYLGRRMDKYKLSYQSTPMGRFKRSVNHLGLSGGLFLGLGSTPMNEFVTNPAISKQYDGLVFANGVAIIGAVQNFSLGVTLGTDHLLDEYRKVWRYEGRIWVGVAIGINLN